MTTRDASVAASFRRLYPDGIFYQTRTGFAWCRPHGESCLEVSAGSVMGVINSMATHHEHGEEDAMATQRASYEAIGLRVLDMFEPPHPDRGLRGAIGRLLWWFLEGARPPVKIKSRG